MALCGFWCSDFDVVGVFGCCLLLVCGCLFAILFVFCWFWLCCDVYVGTLAVVCLCLIVFVFAWLVLVLCYYIV